MKLFTNHIFRHLAALLVMGTVAGSTFGQTREVDATRTAKNTKSIANVVAAPNAAVEPILFEDRNVTCAQLNALHVNGVGDTRFAHINVDYELKLDFLSPNGEFPFTTGNGRFVVGPQYPDRSILVSTSTNPSTINSWGSNLPITAVIIKTGNDSYVYSYQPFRMTDTNLNTGDNREISHLVFCFTEPTGPTSGETSVSGRVVDSYGRGISKAQMVLIHGTTGEARITMTNPFGFYSFTGLDAELYVLNVSHKRYAFQESQRTITLTDNFTMSDFVAEP